MESFSDIFKSFELFILEKIYFKNSFLYRFIPVLFILFFTYLILFIFNSGFLTIIFKGFYLDVIQNKHQEGYFWQLIIDQGSHLFDQNQNTFFKDHMSSRKFRIVIPIISNYLNLSSWNLFLAQILSGLLFSNLLLKYLTSLFEDKLLAFLCLMAFQNVYIGASFFIDLYGHLDGFTYLFLLCTLLFFNKPLLTTLFLQLSFWSDERSLFAVLPILLIYSNKNLHNYKNILPRIVVLCANYVLYFIFYIYIGYINKIGPIYSTQSASLSNHLQNVSDLLSWFGFRLFDSLESFWMIILIALYIVLNKTSILLEKVIFVFYLVVLLCIDLLVADTTRSTSFAFILIVYSLMILKENLKPTFLKELIYMVVFISILQPLVFP